MNPYDLLSRFYDLENADFTEDLDFWVSLAKESGGPVLELGCGTGRVTQQIARAGVNVVGLDNSEPMLTLARAKLNRRPELTARTTLLYGDMTNYMLENPSPGDASTQPPTIRQFPLIIIPFNTFMHFLTTADQLAVLHCARRHLGPGGRLVIDLTHSAPVYATPPASSAALSLERTFTDDIYHLTIQQFSLIHLDRTGQIAYIVYQYDAIAEEGTLKRTLVPLTLRYTFPAEMGLLLNQTGFRLAHLYGDYAESPLTDDSERMIVIAE